MRILLLPATIALAAAPLAAQTTAPSRAPRIERRILTINRAGGARAALGVSTSAGVSARDTLGLLITNVTPNGPADKAGLNEGDRLQAIDGTSLRLSASDVGAEEMAGLMQNRLVRELDKIKPDAEVHLTVYGDGHTRNVALRTVSSDSLYGRTVFSVRAGPGAESAMTLLRTALRDRASLGIGIAANGSRRDTLGVFVTSVNDSGPAARAGLIEGDRIAAINGVDLRVASADAGDDFAGSAKARRLEREVSRLKPGDEVTLRVFADGHFRELKFKAARASDLSRDGNVMFRGAGDFVMPDMPDFPSVRMMLDNLRSLR